MSNFQEYRDVEDDRSPQLLVGLTASEAISRYPDFWLAYRHAAATGGSDRQLSGSVEGGVLGLRRINRDLLETGLRVSRAKSGLLWALAGHGIVTDDVELGLTCASQAFHATTVIPFGPGDHVYSFYFLYHVFDLDGRLEDVCALIKENHPGVSIGNDENITLDAASECLGTVNGSVRREAAAVVQRRLAGQKSRANPALFPGI
jgi:hypothetical protein